MAFVKDPLFILAKMRSDKLKYYTVYDHDGKTKIDEQQDAESTIEEAIQALQTTIENITGLFTIAVSDRNGKEKNAGGPTAGKNLKFTIKIGDEPQRGAVGYAPQQNNNASAAQLIEAAEQRFKLQLDMLKMQYEHKKEIDALKNSNEPDPILLHGIGMLQQLLTTTATPAPIAQPQQMQPTINGPETAEDNVLKIQRLNSAIRRLGAVDPQIIEHLEKLADMAENNKSMFDMAISFLK